MAPNSSIININGKAYNAKTGKLLNASSGSAHKSHTSSKHGGVMDGVIRRPKAQNPKSGQPKKHYQQGSLPSSQQSTARNLKPANNVHRRTSRSVTLFRKGLKDPHNTSATVGPAKSATSTSKAPAKHKNSAVFTTANDEARSKRAEKVKKSLLISRFVPNRTNSQASSIEVTNELKKSEALSGEVMPAPSTNSATAIQPIPPSLVTSATHGNIDDLVDRALASATAHKQSKPNKKRGRLPKMASATALVLFVFLLGSFFAYQYVPNFAMRVASQRAGIDGVLPAYQPSGFNFDSIDVSPGTVEVNYIANADKNRRYSLMQKNSNWDSQSLLNDFVKRESINSQTFTANDKTIYLYNENNATWVSGGVWYVLEGQTANLNQQQLTDIAESI